MYSQLMRVINDTDGRLPTRDDERVVLEFAGSLPKRLETANFIQRHEQELIDRCLSRTRSQYPDLAEEFPAAWEKGTKDVRAVIRYAVQAMLMADPDVAADKMLRWLRAILSAVGLDQACVRDTFTNLRDAFRDMLPADGYALMEPYLTRTIEELCGDRPTLTRG